MTPTAPDIARTTTEKGVVAAILVMSSAMFLLPFADAAAKFAGARLPAIEVAAGRFAFQAIYMLPVVLWTCGAARLIPRPLGPHVLRGVLHAGSSVTFIAAIVHMPLGTAVATVFVWPLVATALSAIFLGEPVGPRRWGAIAVGLVGVLIVIRPGMGGFGLIGLLPVATAVMYAGYFIITRGLVGTAPAVSMHYFTGLSGSVFLVLLMGLAAVLGVELFMPIAPNGLEWGLIALMGLAATVAHMLVILACTWAPASVLAPIGYLEIVGATAVGYMFFGDVPDFWSWVGIAVIIASGLYVWLRERRRNPV